MVLAKERSFLNWPLSTGKIIVHFEMLRINDRLSAEDAYMLAVRFKNTPIGRTAPPVNGQVQGLLMTLPVVFTAE